jgi:Distinct helicase family with a unique C-terminal domain including a metal-binding cysteine cluster
VLTAAMTQHAKALYLFPTKALAQDQVAELLELNQAGDLGVKAFTFDGDTPATRARPSGCMATSWSATRT